MKCILVHQTYHCGHIAWDVWLDLYMEHIKQTEMVQAATTDKCVIIAYRVYGLDHIMAPGWALVKT